jgi:CRISPR system Cascade subunit CasA
LTTLTNLLTDPWITVRRRSGETLTIAPAQITDDLARDPIVDIVAPRPDFRSALYQFCIGLLQTSCMPGGDDDWLDWWEGPPAPAELERRFELFRPAFMVAGDGPLFMQDRSVAKEEATAIGTLLIDEPGETTVKKNRDLFTKRREDGRMSHRHAIQSLITTQCMATEGGRGYFTGLRGGGPLTTLLLPAEDEQHSLWHGLWLNVLSADSWSLVPGIQSVPDARAATFPWLSPDPTAGRGVREVAPETDHSMQHYWAAPRRILLEVNGNADTPCALGDAEGNVSSFRRKTMGLKYPSSYWRHPLSPYRRDKQDFLPIHPRPGGFQYDCWYDWAQPPRPDSPSVLSAAVIASHLQSAVRSGINVRLWASGYNMSKDKPRCFYQVVWPVFHFPGKHAVAARNIIESLSEMASDAARSTRSQVRTAWLRRPADHSDAANNISAAVLANFYERTEDEFFQRLAELHSCCTDEASPALRGEAWRSVLRRCALETFDAYVAVESIADGDAGRIARARNQLERSFNGKNMTSRVDDIANAMDAIRPEGDPV